MNPYQRDAGREAVPLTNDEEAAGAAGAAAPSLQAQQQQQSGRMRDGRAGEEVFLSWEDVLSALAAQGRQQEQAAEGGREEAERPTDRRQLVSENERPIAGKARSSQASQQEEARSSTATTAPKTEEELQQEQFKVSHDYLIR